MLLPAVPRDSKKLPKDVDTTAENPHIEAVANGPFAAGKHILMAEQNQQKTKGTAMAEKTRAKTNHLPDNERQGLMGRALERIYKGRQRKACAHSR